MIDLAQAGDVWWVTLNRPEKANALTAAMLQELVEISEAAQAARAVIITANGSVFSAGADLDEMRAGLATSPLWERLSRAIATLPGLSITALNGTLVGGAMGMVLACDIRLAVPATSFFYPVMKRGFLPQPSDSQRMRALIGPARTKLILMAGQKLTAQQALQYGLIERVVEPDQLLTTALDFAADVVAAPVEIAHGINALCCDRD